MPGITQAVSHRAEVAREVPDSQALLLPPPRAHQLLDLHRGSRRSGVFAVTGTLQVPCQPIFCPPAQAADFLKSSMESSKTTCRRCTSAFSAQPLLAEVSLTQSCVDTSGESWRGRPPPPHCGCVLAKVNKSGLCGLQETPGDPENK